MKLLSLVLVASLAFSGSAFAGPIVAKISLAQQKIEVSIDGVTRYVWPVSTGRSGYRTPPGSYRPQRLERDWYSRKYDNAPMPHSIFFKGGYAIHGTDAVRSLGRPASHGCVRLSRGNAAKLFSLVQQHGSGHTRIIVAR